MQTMLHCGAVLRYDTFTVYIEAQCRFEAYHVGALLAAARVPAVHSQPEAVAVPVHSMHTQTCENKVLYII